MLPGDLFFSKCLLCSHSLRLAFLNQAFLILVKRTFILLSWRFVAFLVHSPIFCGSSDDRRDVIFLQDVTFKRV